MADESILDKALGLIPGVGVTKTRARRPRDPAAAHIASLRKGVAKLARDLDRLIGMVGKEKKASAAGGTAKKPAVARTAKGRGGATKPKKR